MLGKVLKNDLVSIFKSILPGYLVVLLSAIIIRLLVLVGVHFTNPFFSILATILGFVFAMLLVALFFGTFFMVIKRYIINLFSDEGYLTHTLPVKRSTLFLSKYLAGMITLISSLIVILGCIAIAFITSTFMPEIREAIYQILMESNLSFVGFCTIFSTVILLTLSTILLLIYFAINWGYSRNDKKILNAIGMGIGLYFLVQLINIIALIFMLTMMVGFNMTEPIPPYVVQILLGYVIGINLLLSIVFYYLGNRSIVNNLNLA